MASRRVRAVIVAGVLALGPFVVSAEQSTAAPVTPACQGEIATIVGTPRSDSISGSSGDDVIVSLGGVDYVDGGGGNDLICGGSHRDFLRGGVGDDQLFGQRDEDFGDATFFGDVLDGGPGDDLLHGGRIAFWGTNADRATYADAASGVTVDLAAGAATGEGSDVLISIEALTGSTHNDILLGNCCALEDKDNRLDGRGGDDVIRGRDGWDDISGGAGDDRLGGGDDTDEIAGAAGADVLHGGRDNDSLLSDPSSSRNPTPGWNDRLYGGEGRDLLQADPLIGRRSGDDVLVGGPGPDVMWGDAPAKRDGRTPAGGDDRLYGGPGGDRLQADTGDGIPGGSDVLYGNAQDDQLVGGPGRDLGRGGADINGDQCTQLERSYGCELPLSQSIEPSFIISRTVDYS